jgi:DNA-directed RNA polymerase subunit K/omega
VRRVEAPAKKCKGLNVNKFEFVVVSGARAKQLQAGCTPKVAGSEKTARLAMKEVRQGKVAKIEVEPAKA